MVRTAGLSNYSDVHYTGDAVARAVVEHFSPSGRCMEPFAGEGAFLRAMPSDSLWCEIAKGRDFFNFQEPLDWIVTNPPFSILTRVFEHSFSIAQNCVFVIPISKYWSSAPRLQLARSYGGLAKVLHLGTGRQIGFDIGFPFAAMHFRAGYRGPIEQAWLSEDDV